MSRDERPMATDKLIPTLQFQIIGEGGGGGGGRTDNLSIKKRGKWVRKMFSVRSGNPLSLIMGVPNKTSLRHI